MALTGRMVALGEERIETQVLKSPAPINASRMLLTCCLGGEGGGGMGVEVVWFTIMRITMKKMRFCIIVSKRK